MSSKNTSLEGQHQYYDSNQLGTDPEWRQTYNEDDWGNDFVEIEPTRVSMEILLTGSNRRNSSPSYNPEEYNYARMDEIRARKVEERERKTERHKVSV